MSGIRRFSNNNRFSRPQHNQELATVSVYSEQVNGPSSTTSPGGSSRRYQSNTSSNSKQDSKERRSGFKSTNNKDNNVDGNQSNRRNFKPSKPVNDHGSSTSLYKFKLSRPSGRWQYKTTPKPRVAIRRQDNDLESTSQQQTPQINAAAVQQNNAVNENQQDITNSGADSEQIQQSAVYNQQEGTPQSTETTIPIETIKVEISTPADFKDTYYEIATLKSPYTFQVNYNL